MCIRDRIEPEAAESGKAEDKNQDVHEIHIEGIDEQPLKEMEQDSVTYTYEEMAGNKQIKIEGLDEPEPCLLYTSHFKAMRKLASEHPSEKVGEQIRKLYSWNNEGDKLINN